jgi:hypothetical protein
MYNRSPRRCRTGAPAGQSARWYLCFQETGEGTGPTLPVAWKDSALAEGACDQGFRNIVFVEWYCYYTVSHCPNGGLP